MEAGRSGVGFASRAGRFARGEKNAEVPDQRLQTHPVPGRGDDEVGADPLPAGEPDIGPVE